MPPQPPLPDQSSSPAPQPTGPVQPGIVSQPVVSQLPQKPAAAVSKTGTTIGVYRNGLWMSIRHYMAYSRFFRVLRNIIISFIVVAIIAAIGYYLYGRFDYVLKDLYGH